MIGNIDGSVMNVPTDSSNNYFKDASGNTTQEVVFTDAKAYFSGTSLDFKTTTSIESIRVLTPTTLEVNFDRDLDTIVSSEFLIDSAASTSWMTPTNVAIDKDDNSKVVFTITAGSSTEFTAVDANSTVGIKLNTTTAGYTTSTTKDLLGLYFKTTDGNNAIYGNTGSVVYKNDIRPVIKAWVFNDSTHISVAFDGKIDVSSFANDLVLTQTVNGTTVRASDWSVVGSTDSNIVTFVTTTSGLDSSASAVLKTLSDGSIVTVGINGARMAENTGLANSSFVANSMTWGNVSKVMTIKFNQNVDSSSIISGWTDGKTGKTITDSVIVDANGNITFNGATLGNMKSSGLTTAKSYNATYKFVDTTAATKILTISIPTMTESITALSYEPTSSIKTTGGATLTTDFKPIATIDNAAPQISSVSNTGNTSLTVVFNEDMDKTSVETVANWTLTDASGTGSTVASVAYTASTKTAVITLGGTPDIGAADTILAKSAIVDVAGNAMDTSKDTGTYGTPWTIN